MGYRLTTSARKQTENGVRLCDSEPVIKNRLPIDWVNKSVQERKIKIQKDLEAKEMARKVTKIKYVNETQDMSALSLCIEKAESQCAMVNQPLGWQRRQNEKVSLSKGISKSKKDL